MLPGSFSEALAFASSARIALSSMFINELKGRDAIALYGALIEAKIIPEGELETYGTSVTANHRTYELMRTRITAGHNLKYVLLIVRAD